MAALKLPSFTVDFATARAITTSTASPLAAQSGASSVTLHELPKPMNSNEIKLTASLHHSLVDGPIASAEVKDGRAQFPASKLAFRDEKILPRSHGDVLLYLSTPTPRAINGPEGICGQDMVGVLRFPLAAFFNIDRERHAPDSDFRAPLDAAGAGRFEPLANGARRLHAQVSMAENDVFLKAVATVEPHKLSASEEKLVHELSKMHLSGDYIASRLAAASANRVDAKVAFVEKLGGKVDDVKSALNFNVQVGTHSGLPGKASLDPEQYAAYSELLAKYDLGTALAHAYGALSTIAAQAVSDFRAKRGLALMQPVSPTESLEAAREWLSAHDDATAVAAYAEAVQQRVAGFDEQYRGDVSLDLKEDANSLSCRRVRAVSVRAGESVNASGQSLGVEIDAKKAQHRDQLQAAADSLSAGFIDHNQFLKRKGELQSALVSFSGDCEDVSAVLANAINVVLTADGEALRAQLSNEGQRSANELLAVHDPAIALLGEGLSFKARRANLAASIALVMARAASVQAHDGADGSALAVPEQYTAKGVWESCQMELANPLCQLAGHATVVLGPRIHSCAAADSPQPRLSQLQGRQWSVKEGTGPRSDVRTDTNVQVASIDKVAGASGLGASVSDSGLACAGKKVVPSMPISAVMNQFGQLAVKRAVETRADGVLSHNMMLSSVADLREKQGFYAYVISVGGGLALNIGHDGTSTQAFPMPAAWQLASAEPKANSYGAQPPTAVLCRSGVGGEELALLDAIASSQRGLYKNINELYDAAGYKRAPLECMLRPALACSSGERAHTIAISVRGSQLSLPDSPTLEQQCAFFAEEHRRVNAEAAKLGAGAFAEMLSTCESRIHVPVDAPALPLAVPLASEPNPLRSAPAQAQIGAPFVDPAALDASSLDIKFGEDNTLKAAEKAADVTPGVSSAHMSHGYYVAHPHAHVHHAYAHPHAHMHHAHMHSAHGHGHMHHGHAYSAY